ncbi:nitrilase [Phlyctema vagabunda]|uniref:Nitrilase n=1 Tax=Phlyctema vagabunda TaxID=108571 RepID=A0ABR4PXR6_9HELO
MSGFQAPILDALSSFEYDPIMSALNATLSLTVAAVHAAPVYMDKNATTAKIISLIQQAAGEGIDLLAFPEAFLPGYPYFVQMFAPTLLWLVVASYVRESVEASGPEMARIREACAMWGVAISLGFSERIANGTAIFNSQIFIDKKGDVLGVHRKLQPTLGERILWTQGGGRSLHAYPSDDGYIIGGLACSENTMNGARQALIEDGEQIHVGAWPALAALPGQAPFIDNQTEAITKAHALSAQVFVIATSDYVDDRTVNWIRNNVGNQTTLSTGGGWSAIVDPNTVYVAGPHTGPEEKFVKADIDLSLIQVAKVLTDATASYKRPEVLKFNVNRDPLWPDEFDV